MAPALEAGEAKGIVMLGFFRVTSSLLQKMQSTNSGLVKEVLVIDFNPDVYRELSRRAVKCIYGDISHMATLREAGIENARVVLSTVPDGILKGTDNLRLIKQVRGLAPNASIVCTAESVPSALEMYRSGADYVFLPRIAAAEDLIEVLEQVQNQTLDQAREQQIRALMERDEVV